MILKTMWQRYEMLIYLKNALINKGYDYNILSYINSQIEILNILIEKESFEVLNKLLFEKTYYRLLIRIEKGTENLINIYNYPDQWSICKIEEYNAWEDENSLIFSIEEKGKLVFNKKPIGQKYSTNSNKWQ